MTWQGAVAAALGGAIARVEPVAGGDINEAYRVRLADGRELFVKTHAQAPPDLFAAEAEGLAWLAEGPLRVPRVLAAGDAFLALEWLALGARGPGFDAALGRGLAALHRLGAPSFGLAHDNWLATLPQSNAPAPDWPTFYVERRLRPLCRLARLGLDRALDALLAHPDLFGPSEPPARLHGDLWWGNVLSVAGAPVLIDPAVYGGHREIDLAMLALFGPLPDALISAYDEVYPLSSNWRDRLGLHQLYPLAAHACLFGGSYASQMGTVLSKYSCDL